MNIFDIPLYYISFKRNLDVEKHYKEHGFTNINFFKAIDGRKLDPTQLRKDRVISIRSYDDLMSGRREHSGISSLGTIGCSLSHYELWKKCIRNNWPFIIVAEEDNFIKNKLDENMINEIIRIINQPNGFFTGRKIVNQEHRIYSQGLNFYIASKGACEELVKDFFPIDVQTDWHHGHLATIGKINLEGYPIAEQLNNHISTTGDKCFVCKIPKNKAFYIVFIVIFIILLISIIILTIILIRKKNLKI